MGGKRKLKAAKPRRFKDHRSTEAREWGEAYDAIAARCPPTDALARKLTGVAADLLHDYEQLRQASQVTRKKSASASRKTAGLILGFIRLLGSGNGGNDEPRDLARMLADLSEPNP